MNATQVKDLLDAARKYAEGEVLRYGQRLSDLPRIGVMIERLLKVPSFEDVSNLTIGADYTAGAGDRSKVYLSLEKPDSEFPRAVVKALGIRLTKAPDGESIRCTGEFEGIGLSISGYLPDSCEITYETVHVPAHDEQRPKIMCRPTGEVNGG